MLSAPLVHGAYQGEPSFEPGALLVMDFVQGRYRRGPGRGRVASDPAGVSGWQSVGHAGFGRTRVNGAYPPFAPDAPLIGDGGLLIPEARTNLSPQRSPFEIYPAGLTDDGRSVVNGLASPDGMNTVSRLSDLSTTSNKSLTIASSATVVPGQAYVAIFGIAKATGPTDAAGHSRPTLLRVNRSGSISQRLFNAFTGSGEVGLTVRDMGTWWRVTMPFTPGAGETWANMAVWPAHDPSVTNTGYCDVWFGNILAAPDINDPPILQTTGLPATRTAVAQSVGGLVLPPAIEVRSRFRINAEPGAGTFRRVFSINNGGTSNAADVYINGTRNIRLFARSAATTVVDGGPASQLEIGRYYDLVARYQADAFSLSLDGVPVFSATSGGMPVGLNRIQFGNNAEFLSARTLNGEIANLSIREAA